MRKYVIAIYIRLSVEDSKTESLSIPNQRLILREKAMSLPQWGNAELLEFVDNGHTGTNFERPGVQELLSMVQTGQIDCILVKDLSRFGRNSIETGYFIERVFPLYHTRFIAVSDDFDSDNYKGDTGGIDVAFKYLINECYSKDMSVKTKSAKYAKMRRGEYQSAICPYGYRKGADGRMEPDEEAAAVVRQIFTWAADGCSAGEITRKLYERHIPTPGEYKALHGRAHYDISRTQGIWCNTAVLRILEDQRYVGTYIIGKRTVREVGSSRTRLKEESQWFKIPDHHPAVVSQAQFDLANAQIQRYRLSGKQNHEYLLRGKIYCGCCGHAMRRKGGSDTFYCRYSEVSEDLACHGLEVKQGELEQAVFETLRAQLLPLAGVDAGADTLDIRSAQEAAHEEVIQKIQEQKRLLYEQFMMEEIDLPTYRQQKAALDDSLIKEKNVHAAIAAQAKQAHMDQETRERHTAITQEITGAKGLTKSMVDTLVHRVLVFPGDHIEIDYAVKDFFA